MQLIRWHYARADHKPDAIAKDSEQAAGQPTNPGAALISRACLPDSASGPTSV
jgi:hypothetical protein